MPLPALNNEEKEEEEAEEERINKVVPPVAEPEIIQTHSIQHSSVVTPSTQIKGTSGSIPKTKKNKHYGIIALAILLVAALILGVASLSGNSDERDEFYSCKTKEDYERFISNHPNSSYKSKAEIHIRLLTKHSRQSSTQEDSINDQKTIKEIKSSTDKSVNNNQHLYIHDKEQISDNTDIVFDDTKEVQNSKSSKSKSNNSSDNNEQNDNNSSVQSNYQPQNRSVDKEQIRTPEVKRNNNNSETKNIKIPVRGDNPPQRGFPSRPDKGYRESFSKHGTPAEPQLRHFENNNKN